jgi:hypothetical protein
VAARNTVLARTLCECRGMLTPTSVPIAQTELIGEALPIIAHRPPA